MLAPAATQAVAAQYANVTPVEHVYPLVRSQKQLDRVLDEIEESPGIVLCGIGIAT
jgi:regulator of PEP synthase PpsR (kinase-PPPase family)